MAPRLTRLLQAVGLTVGISLVAAQSAQAALMISATINGVDVCVTDNNVACGWGLNLTDLDADPNQILLASQSVGGVFLEGTAAEARFGTLGGLSNRLDSSSLRIRNDTGAIVIANVAVSATGFTPIASQAFASGSGTWQEVGGSTIDLFWYNDPTNTQGATTPANRPGNLLATFSDTAQAPLDSWSTGTLGPFVVNDPSEFSMTLAFDISLQPGEELISRGMNEVKPVVPEPAMLALFGAALSAGALRLRRRRNG